MDEKLISIICPVYNSETFLKECITSVLNQTDSNWELLLIDDGSKDNSGLISDEFSKKDSRIKVVHKANGGQMQARIDGIKKSKGNYIMFLDSDDLLDKNAVKEMMINITNDCDVDAILFNAKVFPEKANAKSLPHIYESQKLSAKRDIVQFTFENQMFGYLWMYCFKKEILLKVIEQKNPFINVRYTEDGAFIYNAVSICNNAVIIEKNFYYYRDNAFSITHNLTEKDRIDRYYVFEYIYGNIFELQRELNLSNDISSMVSWAMFSMLIYITEKKLFKEMFKKARKSNIFKRVCSIANIKNKQFKLYRLLLKLNLPFIFYKYSHK